MIQALPFALDQPAVNPERVKERGVRFLCLEQIFVQYNPNVKFVPDKDESQ